jgi:hypothetical protein
MKIRVNSVHVFDLLDPLESTIRIEPFESSFLHSFWRDTVSTPSSAQTARRMLSEEHGLEWRSFRPTMTLTMTKAFLTQ